MSTNPAPSTPQPKRSLFGIPGTSRRHSLGIMPPPNGNPSLAVAHSPHPTPAGSGSGSSSSSGIPSFRALRSLLPFGGGGSSNSNKNSSNASTSINGGSQGQQAAPATSRPSFGFGSVRRSMARDRERKASLGNEPFKAQVISIERSKSDSQVTEDGLNVRRSVSLSRLEDQLTTLDGRSSDTAPTLRTPSPTIPLSQELSTIIEADSSGVSRLGLHPLSSLSPSSLSPSPSPSSFASALPHSHSRSHSPSHSHSHSPSPSPSPTMVLNPAFLQPIPTAHASAHAHGQIQRNLSSSASTARTSDFDADTSTSPLSFSPSQLKREVLDAMRGPPSSSSDGISPHRTSAALDWSNAGEPVIIDADADADESFNLNNGSVLPDPDPDLVALLSPNTMAAKSLARSQAHSHSHSKQPSLLPKLRYNANANSSAPSSPTTTRFLPPSPKTPTSAGATATPRHSPLGSSGGSGSGSNGWGGGGQGGLSPSKSPPSPRSPASPMGFGAGGQSTPAVCPLSREACLLDLRRPHDTSYSPCSLTVYIRSLGTHLETSIPGSWNVHRGTAWWPYKMHIVNRHLRDSNIETLANAGRECHPEREQPSAGDTHG
ncbi:hypothetical protein NMY22_g19606 [Coprinellus aureogranulatus]|nr:hypothetical protein NMY22_g19606 [Coprinellus aureogranulatus]